jgi:DNA invertase Pin-like site-specific DNA recombinase
MKLIAYYRVSTAKQGKSGLGLEGQQAAVKTFAKTNGVTVLAAYTEVETGKDNSRPELKAALLHAKRSGAKLVVAKLDRLSRNAAFLLNLQEAKVPFVACDNPTANELTIGILAVIAQDEAKRISERTKAALQAAKDRGTLLGSARPGHWDGKEADRKEWLVNAREKANEIRQANAKASHDELCPLMLALKAEGLTQEQIAARLNSDGWRTRQGKEWNTVYVCRFLKKCEA